MRNKKGITLLSLVITIILMLILATVSISAGIESYNTMKVQSFVGKMSTVQEALDKLCEKYTTDEISAMGLDYSSAPSSAQLILDTVITSGQAGNLNCWFYSDSELTADTTLTSIDGVNTNYRYFDEDDIATILGVSNFDTPIWLNPITRNIIALDGVTDDDVKYYRQYDLANGQTLYYP